MAWQAQLVLAVVFGAAGWHHARHLERKYGAPAFGLPDWVWGIITFVSLLLGLILLAVAERTLKKNVQPNSIEMPSYASVPVLASAAHEPMAAPLPVAAPPAVPAGWQPDPSGKYQHRWWDGQAWTRSVATDGITGTDA
ncbi:MAG: DUF2510 domain-containing protein [Actinomycetota bacterium]|nr:DUF2510 domain-containing protein [Actinomycetota bacterium]